MALGAVERLRPGVADAVFDDRVGQGFAVGAKANGLPDVSSNIEMFCGGVEVSAYVDERNFVYGWTTKRW
jgi:hypothetical protein